ncbi:MAG: hypothetical protein ACR2OR_08450 [Hyphomicrobiales bacterium]
MTEDQKFVVRGALDRVLASDVFKNKDRLHVFLRYVVEEELEGRAESIRGKNIAKDAFGRELGDGDTENVVRAHARRVRQCLGEYYRTGGTQDRVQIKLESGSYVPLFEFGNHIAPGGTKAAEAASGWDWRQLGFGALGGLAIAVGAALLVGSNWSNQGTAETRRQGRNGQEPWSRYHRIQRLRKEWALGC